MEEKTNMFCEQCKKTFSNVSNLKKHVKRLHPEEHNYLKSLQKKQNVERDPTKDCKVCNKTFSNLYNLDKHMKRLHSERSKCLRFVPKWESMEEKEKLKKNCSLCQKIFSNLSNLRQHVKRLHPKETTYLKSLKQRENKDYKFICGQCSKRFMYLTNFNSHMRTHVGNNMQSNFQVKRQKCALCDYYCVKKSMLIHYRENHDIVIQENYIIFTSVEDFYSWKEKYENKTNAQFVKEFYTLREGRLYKGFRCHRSGFYVTKSSGLRRLKTQGSNKINGFCPASIKLKKNNDKEYHVHIVETHVGHQTEIRHLNLKKSERELMATKIALNISFGDILDGVRDSICNSNLQRLHLLTKKDLYNIEKSFNLCSSVRHSNDVISVESWINDMQHKGDAVLFYKQQGCTLNDWSVLKENDFVLIIMTAAQCEMLKKYGSDHVCIDGIQGISSYDFQLITLLVVDDIDQGFPCSFLISNRTDKDIINIFFHYVKNQIGSEVCPKVFMSDMENAFFNAWLEIMSPPKLRLFCTWHVDEAWRENLKTKVKTKEKQVEVYKKLRTFLEEKDIKTFDIKLFKFYDSINLDKDTAEFAEYFRNYYLTNTSYWAYCYRLSVGINSNTHLERMHLTLKHTYLKSLRVKRLDKGINALMRIVRDQCLDRLIILNEGKLTKKIQNIRSRHTNSTDLDVNLVKCSNNGWTVLSKEMHELYLIQKVKENCDCQLRCSDCEACLHQFICSCIDSSVEYNMCKHIHLICRYLQNQNVFIATSHETADVLEENESIAAESSSNTHESHTILTDISSKPTSSCLETSKPELVKNLTELLEQVQGMSSEELMVVKKSITSIKSTIDALRSSSNTLNPDVKTLHIKKENK